MFLYGVLFLLFVFKEIHSIPQIFTKKSDPLIFCQFRINEMSVPANAEELKELCKKLEAYYFCYHRNEPFKPLSGFSFYLKNAEPLIRSICDETSIFHKTYVRNADCFKKIEEDWIGITGVIDIVGTNSAGQYIKFLPGNVTKREEFCVKGEFMQKAMRKLLRDICGYNALKLYQRLIDISQYKHSYCTHSETKKSYLHPLLVLQNIIAKRAELYQVRLNQKRVLPFRTPVAGRVNLWIKQVRELNIQAAQYYTKYEKTEL